MIKVTIIVPFPELYDLAEEALRADARPGVEYAITHIRGTSVTDLALEDADIMLGRGLTYQAVRERYPDRTVLELTVSAYDLLRAIYRCRKEYGARRLAVIGSASVLYDVDTLKEMVDAELTIFRIHNEEEIRDALREAEAAGFDAIVGGLTACTMGEERGWRCTVIRTGEETLRMSIKEAMNTAAVMFNERAKAEISRIILQNSKEAVLYFDQDGILAMHNRRVAETLNLPEGRVAVGRRARDLFKDKDILAAIRERREVGGLIRTINQTLLVSDYMPVEVESQAIGVICSFQRVNEIQAAETRIRRELHRKGLAARYGFDDIVHAGAALAATIDTARKYAKVDANVLIIGETGTGKELFAQSIHNASQRRDGPFVAVNCASLPENLLESELFGYVEGAFSGAAKGGKTGLFELAHGGTLFLDEIGEMPFNLQATLLRALQEGEIRKIGDDRIIPVNVRIVSATNRDLRRKVCDGAFRRDLLYRLDVLALNIPPLRERREDIARIAKHYIEGYCQQYRKPALALGDDALAAFARYDWPGNTRELKNICERLVVLGDGAGSIGAEVAERVLALATYPAEGEGDCPEVVPVSPRELPNIENLREFVDALKVRREDIAGMLGISRTTLWRRMKKS